MARGKAKSHSEKLAAAGIEPEQGIDITADLAESPTAIREPGPFPGVALMLPLTGLIPTGYVSNHVDARLTPRQGLALKMITAGLVAEGKVLLTGRKVQTSADAVRYLLEQVAGSIDGNA